MLLRLRGTGNAAADTSRAKWDKMRLQLEASEGRRRIDPNVFILHWWLSRHDYVSRNKLFREIRQTVKSKPLAKDALNDLKDDGVFYRRATDPMSRTWPVEEQQAARSLAALELFGVVQPAPLLLALVRARNDSPKLRAAHFKDTLRVIEHYHFQNTVVSQLSSSGGVSSMYAKAARDLHNAGGNQQARATVLKGLRDKLKDRAADRDLFVLAFQDRFFFTNENTRDSKLVRYVLGRFLRHHNPATGQDNLSIEHVMPQDAIAAGSGADVVGALGNLLLVSEPVNSALGNKSFAQKKTILAGMGAAYDIGHILDRNAWTQTEIERRTLKLAEDAYDTVWKL